MATTAKTAPTVIRTWRVVRCFCTESLFKIRLLAAQWHRVPQSVIPRRVLPTLLRGYSQLRTFRRSRWTTAPSMQSGWSEALRRRGLLLPTAARAGCPSGRCRDMVSPRLVRTKIHRDCLTRPRSPRLLLRSSLLSRHSDWGLTACCRSVRGRQRMVRKRHGPGALAPGSPVLEIVLLPLPDERVRLTDPERRLLASRVEPLGSSRACPQERSPRFSLPPARPGTRAIRSMA
jgi:hypothetical protein